MIIETEPAGLMMLRYKLYFNQQTPDPEDPWILTYLQEHRLEARRELHEEHEGVPYTVLHFGQCYLGRHVHELAELYKRGVEHTVLAQYLCEVLTHSTDPAIQTVTADLTEPAMQQLAVRLAARLHATTQFEPTEDRNLRVILDDAAIGTALLTLPPVAAAE
ncbi:MAG: hypothetical protein AB7N91_25290 [Candidatus Tectimicrobiota bacterium]